MPVFHITAPDGTQYEVNGPEGATEQDALAQVQAQHGVNAPPPASPAPQEPGLMASMGNYAHGIAQGVSDIPENLITLGLKGTDAVGLTNNRAPEVQSFFNDTSGMGNDRVSKGGRVIGNVIGSLPTAPIAGVPFVGPALAGAAGGALSTHTDTGEDFGTNAAMGAAGGQLFHGAGKLVSKLGSAKEAVPSIADLRTAADNAYDAFDNSGHIVAAPALGDLVSRLQSTLANEGMDATLHPSATAAFNRVAGEQGNNVTFKGMDILRKVAGDATGAQAPADQRMAFFVRNGIDDFMNGLKPTDLVPGQGVANPAPAVEQLNEARGLWRRASQAGDIADAIDKAGIKATGYSQSGEENALRAQFRQMALNDGQMAGFQPEVQGAVRDVATGTPGGNIARTLGKLAPRGPVSTMGAIATGAATGTGPLPLILGEAAKYLATRGTRSAAQRAFDTAALGRAPVTSVAPGAAALADIFHNLSGVGGAGAARAGQ